MTDLSRRATVLCSMSCRTAERPRLWKAPRPPPQLRHRAKSLPVPRGSRAIAGGTQSSLPMLACMHRAHVWLPEAHTHTQGHMTRAHVWLPEAHTHTQGHMTRAHVWLPEAHTHTQGHMTRAHVWLPEAHAHTQGHMHIQPRPCAMGLHFVMA